MTSAGFSLNAPAKPFCRFEPLHCHKALRMAAG
jgi:hypothetical protein